MLEESIRSHGGDARATFLFFVRSRRFAGAARTSCRADCRRLRCLRFFFFIRTPKQQVGKCALRRREQLKPKISGQNAAAPAKDRRAFAGGRGYMTHAGLAVMAVAARLGPA
jgi:hypothetical protein